MAEFFKSDDDVLTVEINGRFVGSVTKADGFCIDPSLYSSVVKFSPEELRDIARVVEAMIDNEKKNIPDRGRFIW